MRLTPLETDLLKALKAMVREETCVAKVSYREWDGQRFAFTDANWRRADPTGFTNIVAARAAIAHAAKKVEASRP